MTLSYTARFKLAVPDFLTEPWHSEFASAMESIDRIIYDALLAQSTSLWLNSTAYVIGNTVIDPDSGGIYTCAVSHTSTASPQTFTQELVAHPTYWALLAPTLASQVEAEAGTNNSKYMSPLRTTQAMAALSAQITPVVPHSGRLTVTSATQLKFSPYNGNRIKIDGNIYEIPVAGIAGLGKTGVYVNGVAGQNLAANTVYLVTVAVIAGVLTGKYSALTGVNHRPSQTLGNEGVEVLTNAAGTIETPSETLIGIIRTNASAEFEDLPWRRFVRSWFNRTVTTFHTWMSASHATVSATYVEIASGIQIEWVNFAGEVMFMHWGFPVFATVSVAGEASTSIGLDSITVPQNTFAYCTLPASQDTRSLTVSLNVSPAQGYHYATPLYRSHSTGTRSITAFSNGNNDGDRPVFSALLIPDAGLASVS